MLLAFFLKGIAVGIVIAMPVGPVGVLCVRRTLFQGPLYGLVSGIGAATADMVFAIIAGFGFTMVRGWLLDYEDWLAGAGGVFLLYVGIRAFFHPPEIDPRPVDRDGFAADFASTFVLTITNPITILSFAAIFAKLGLGERDAGPIETLTLVGGVLAGSLLWWLALSFGLARLRRSAGVRQLRWLNRVSGAILTLSGVGLLVSVCLSVAGAAPRAAIPAAPVPVSVTAVPSGRSGSRGF